MNYSPIKICFYICIALLIMFGLTFLSQTRSINQTETEEGFFVGDWYFKYPNTASFLMRKGGSKDDFKSMDSIVDNIEMGLNDEIIATVPDFSKIDTLKVERISYPSNKHDFLAKLKSQLQSSSTRIIHYGDSQLEGDRITGYLRNRLQGIYKGTGSGFTPILQVYHSVSSEVQVSENWIRYARFDPTQKPLLHKKYGAYTSLSRFTPALDSINLIDLDTLPVIRASIEIKIPTRSFDRLKDYTQIGLHYGDAHAPTSIEVYADGTLIKSGELVADGNYHNYKIKLDAPSNLRIELEGKISPDFYGITLDGEEGIQMDNVAMRGSSGTIFAGLDNENFSRMYQELNPKLLIFQYGGNSVPYIKDSLQVTNYASYLRNHINWVKRKSQDAQVIFIGPSDMTTMIHGEMQTYPLLPYLNKVLKEMCLENDIAYWSMFDAMGGKGSMAHWVDQKLAANDYTHFSHSGTRVISELFFLSLYLDLNSIP